jgi:hypothetical protein
MTASRMLALGLCSLALAGCSSTDWSKQPLPVTVSAANFTAGTPESVYLQVHEPPKILDATPPPPVAPAHPVFYGFVPGDILASDLPLETLYRELAIPLAKRGYFNVVYEVKAGFLPQHIDYLLRVHYGVRSWKTPVVRTDGITWGNDGLMTAERNPYASWQVGSDAIIDPRAGMDPAEVYRIAAYFQDQLKTAIKTENAFTPTNFQDREAADTALIVIDAFRFDQVAKMGRTAPCAWSTFIAVPLHPGQEMSQLVRTMAHAATPYLGETTHGIQEYDVPPGKVLMGEPVAVPDHAPEH